MKGDYYIITQLHNILIFAQNSKIHNIYLYSCNFTYVVQIEIIAKLKSDLDSVILFPL